MLARLTIASLAALAVAAPAADAARVTIGSDLTAPATASFPKPVDTAFWPSALAGGGAFVSPVKGQAIITRLKGKIAAVPGGSSPFDLIHFQVLRPTSSGGTVIVSSEDDYHLPASGDANQVNQWFSSFLCVEKGDVITFSNSGGYHAGDYDNGVPYQVFGQVPGSSTQTFTGEGKDNNGDTLTGTTLKDTELLLQVVIGTGADARPYCGGTAKVPNPGAYPPADETPPASGGGGGTGGTGGSGGGGSTPAAPKGVATVPSQKLRVRSGKVKVKVSCSSAGPCQDTLLLSYKSAKVASKAFALGPGTSGTATLKLTAKGRKLLRQKGGRYTVKLDAGGPTTHLVLRKAS